jgi:hypothetical protein
MSLRRTQPRKTLICRISIYWKDEGGVPSMQSGLVEDRSLCGLGISVPEFGSITKMRTGTAAARASSGCV